MDIQIEIVKEYKDGSADAMVHFDKEGLAMLVQEGVISILLKYIEQKKCPSASWWEGDPTCGGLTENYGLEKANDERK